MKRRPNRRCAQSNAAATMRSSAEVGLDLGFVEVDSAPGAPSRRSSASPRARCASVSPRDSASACERLALVAARAFAGSQTCSSSSVDRAGVPRHRVGERVVGVARVAVQARLLVAQREDLARDGRLSCSPACSPRAVQARQACSRRSRRSEKVRNGTMCERDSVITHAPAMPRSARRLARRGAHEVGQARRDRPRRAAPAGSSLRRRSTFWPKRVVSSARRSHRSAHSAPAPRGRAARRRARSPDGSARAARSCSASRPSVGAPFVQRVDAREQRRVHVDARCRARPAAAPSRAAPPAARARFRAARQVVEQRARAAPAAGRCGRSAATVLSKSARVGPTRRWRRSRRDAACSAASNAGGKCSGADSAKGGRPYGAVQGAAGGWRGGRGCMDHSRRGPPRARGLYTARNDRDNTGRAGRGPIRA